MSNLILVAGINGFVGHHVANELLNRGYRVHGIGTHNQLDKDLVKPGITYEEIDLMRPGDIKSMEAGNIYAVINLAGLAQVGASFGQSQVYESVNVSVHINLLDHLLESGFNGRYIAVSSGAVYDSNQEMPLNETSRLADSGSPYAISKIKLENRLNKYVGSGADIIIARPFNHTGPGQMPGFILPDIVSGILSKPELNISPANTSRDYTDVRDIAKAYAGLIESDNLKHRTYNICSGKAVSRDEILKLALDAAGKPDVKIVKDSSLVRQGDTEIIYGSHKLISEDTGWQPVIPLDKTVADFVEWYKENNKGK